MDLSSDVYRELGKTFINIGQAVIIATLAAWLLSKEHAAWWLGLISLGLSIVLITLGLALIQKAYWTKQREERHHG